MTVAFHDEAAAEYDAAFDWYLARSPRDLTQRLNGRSAWLFSLPVVGHRDHQELDDFCSEDFPSF